MKRTACILMAFICCICFTASAGSHIGIQWDLAGKTNSSIVHIDLYDENDMISMISDMIPDIMIQSSDNNTNLFGLFSLIFDLSPEWFVDFRNRAEDILREWIQTRNKEFSTGIYTGPLFDKAASVCVTEFMLSDLILYIEQITGQGNTGHDPERLIACAARNVRDIINTNNPLIRVKNYDNDKYISADVISGYQVIMTFSLDNTSDGLKRIQITQRENGRYFLRDITAQYDDKGFSLDNEIFSSDSSIFDRLEEEPFIRESCNYVSDSEETGKLSYTFEAAQKDIKIAMTGNVSEAEAEGYIKLGEDSEAVFSFLIVQDEKKKDQDPASYQVLYLDQKEEYPIISLTFKAGLINRMAEILPSLPAAYQNFIMEMIVNR